MGPRIHFSESSSRSWTNDTLVKSILALTSILSSAYATAAAADQAAQRKVTIPGSNYEVSLGGTVTAPASILTQPFLTAIEAWLSAEYG